MEAGPDARSAPRARLCFLSVIDYNRFARAGGFPEIRRGRAS